MSAGLKIEPQGELHRCHPYIYFKVGQRFQHRSDKWKTSVFVSDIRSLVYNEGLDKRMRQR